MKNIEEIRESIKEMEEFLVADSHALYEDFKYICGYSNKEAQIATENVINEEKRLFS